LRGLLLASDGLNSEVNAIAGRDSMELAGFSESSVLIQHVDADVADENEPVLYPSVYLYSERMDNRLIEKFRRFSGSLIVTASVRVSGERFPPLEARLARYIEALTAVLASNQGSWTDNVAFNGAYEVRFEKVRPGGKNFVQSATIEIGLQAHA
jgi:hypothetical protein